MVGYAWAVVGLSPFVFSPNVGPIVFRFLSFLAKWMTACHLAKIVLFIYFYLNGMDTTG